MYPAFVYAFLCTMNARKMQDADEGCYLRKRVMMIMRDGRYIYEQTKGESPTTTMVVFQRERGSMSMSLLPAGV